MNLLYTEEERGSWAVFVRSAGAAASGKYASTQSRMYRLSNGTATLEMNDVGLNHETRVQFCCSQLIYDLLNGCFHSVTEAYA